ncbi:MAG: YbaB/EbfC family nucleoid-associated protein [Clostridiales bacterium]|nr:YbaB/EbfC family nucleoid-associated protein [Clostridiales bacterium]
MAGYRGGFGGGFGGGNQMQMMKQIQKMQQEMMKAQEELEQAEIEGTASNGLVKVTLNGKGEFLGISINPDVVDVDDIEMLEDLIVVAFNDAKSKADELSQQKLGKFSALGGF